MEKHVRGPAAIVHRSSAEVMAPPLDGDAAACDPGARSLARHATDRHQGFRLAAKNIARCFRMRLRYASRELSWDKSACRPSCITKAGLPDRMQQRRPASFQ